MSPELHQARNGFKRLISENGSRVTLMRQPLVVDPNDPSKLVPDPVGVMTEHSIYCRITHERGIVAQDTLNPAGLSTNLQRMIMSDWQNIPHQYDIFEWNDYTFEIGPVDPIYKFGGIVGYQAPLKEAET